MYSPLIELVFQKYWQFTKDALRCRGASCVFKVDQHSTFAVDALYAILCDDKAWLGMAIHYWPFVRGIQLWRMVPIRNTQLLWKVCPCYWVVMAGSTLPVVLLLFPRQQLFSLQIQPKIGQQVVWLNSYLPSATNIRWWIRSALVQIMACRLFGTKPLSKPMPGYSQLDT